MRNRLLAPGPWTYITPRGGASHTLRGGVLPVAGGLALGVVFEVVGVGADGRGRGLEARGPAGLALRRPADGRDRRRPACRASIRRPAPSWHPVLAENESQSPFVSG